MTLSFAYMGQDFEGYGYAGRKMAQSLSCTHSVRDYDLSKIEEWDGELIEIPGTVVLFYMPEWYEYIRCDHLVGFTMFEGDGLPTPRVELINKYADSCLVPSKWCHAGFVESGVQVPMEVVPLGVSPQDYPLVDRKGRTGTYRFLWNGNNDIRKGWDLVYGAFWQAFRGSSEVELILHFRDRVPEGGCFSDSNVRVVTGILPRDEYLGLLEEADCFVFPSRAEGWGLPPREAAATGLPVIVNNYGGLAENVDRWAVPIRSCRTQRVRFWGFDDQKISWSQPCQHDLVDSMLDCFHLREQAYLRGEKASRWLVEHETWDHAAGALIAAVGRLTC